METIVSKGDFARLKGRTPAAVSQWIANGRITKAALVGEGVRARIKVEQANADLARNLDPVEQDKQAQPILPPVMALPTSSGVSADDEILRRRRTADAERAEHDAEAARRRNAVDEGRWIDAAAAKREWGRQLAKVYADTDTFLTNTLAQDVANAYGLDWKVLSVRIRNAYRKHRSQIAEQAQAEVDAIDAPASEAAE